MKKSHTLRILLALLVIFGAITDIGAAMTNLRFKAQQEALEEQIAAILAEMSRAQ